MPKVELTQPTILGEVLNTQVQVSLNTLLTHIPSLKTDLVTWLEKDRESPQDEVRCDFIEEGADRQKIAIASWEGDASNVMLPITYKAYSAVSSIVDGGSGINIIAKKLYDAWDLPKMEPAPFSIKLADQRRVTPLGLVKNVPVKVAGIRFLIAFVVMDLPLHSSSFSVLLGRPWLKAVTVMHDWKNNTLDFRVETELLR